MHESLFGTLAANLRRSVFQARDHVATCTWHTLCLSADTSNSLTEDIDEKISIGFGSSDRRRNGDERRPGAGGISKPAIQCKSYGER
jgi:hypothetical protein